jgi:cytochrome P460
LLRGSCIHDSAGASLNPWHEGVADTFVLSTIRVASDQMRLRRGLVCDPQERFPMNRKSKLTRVAATAALAALCAAAVYAQDKYSLKSPSGIAFSDFKGYEDWSVVSSARTDEVLKVIVANPAMIKAYKAGIPGNGQPFPEGAMIAKLQWKPKKSTEAQFAVDVPDVFTQAFVMEKDSARFPKSGGWGYAVFNYEPASDKFSADAASPSDCGHACHLVVKGKDYIFHPYQKR